MSSMVNYNGIDVQEALTHLLKSANLSLDDVAADMKKAERRKILENHTAPITEGNDGRFRTYIKLENGKRKQIAKSTIEKVEDALVEFYSSQLEKSSVEKMTLEALYPRWIEYKKLHRAAPSYIRRINTDWKRYYEGTDIVKKPIKMLDKMTLDIWCHELIAETGRSKKAYYNASTIMRQVLDFAVDSNYIQQNLFLQVKLNNKLVFDPEKKKDSELEVFSLEEVKLLCELAFEDFYAGHNTVHKLASLTIPFQLQVGLRIGELGAVRYSDIQGDELIVRRMYRTREKEVVDYLKGHHESRTVPLTAEALRIINLAKNYQQEYNLDDSGYIFSVTGEPLADSTIAKLYRRYCSMMGTPHKSSHKARKSYISALIDGKVNINTIREIVGHASEQTTYRCYCYDRKSKSERVALIEKALS